MTKKTAESMLTKISKQQDKAYQKQVLASKEVARLGDIKASLLRYLNEESGQPHAEPAPEITRVA